MFNFSFQIGQNVSSKSGVQYLITGHINDRACDQPTYWAKKIRNGSIVPGAKIIKESSLKG